jgi:hypothetical protein
MNYIIEHKEYSGLFWDSILGFFDVIEYADTYKNLEDANTELIRTNGQGFVRALEDGEMEGAE